MNQGNIQDLRDLLWSYFGNKTDLVLAKAIHDVGASSIQTMDYAKREEFLNYLLYQVLTGVVSESKIGYFEFKLRRLLEIETVSISEDAKNAFVRD